MTVTGTTDTGLLQSVLEAAQAREEYGIELLRKAQDTARQQGEAMVQVLEQAVISAPSGLLDTYA